MESSFSSSKRAKEHQNPSSYAKVMLKTVKQIFQSAGGRTVWCAQAGQSGRGGDSGQYRPETPVGRIVRSVLARQSGPVEPELPEHELDEFWRKNSNQNLKLMGENKKLSHGNAGDGRSTRLATNPWIKTYQNALKSQIDPKHEIGAIFLGIFEFMGKKTKSRRNPWQPKAADTRCYGVTLWVARSSRISWSNRWESEGKGRR